MTEPSHTPSPAAQATDADKAGTAPRSWPEPRTWIVLGAVLLAQLLIALLAVLPQLSPRVSGTEVYLRVAPVDPIDPFRGAYVALSYPDLPNARTTDGRVTDELGVAYVPLSQGPDYWVGGPIRRSAPDGVYLRCNDDSWQLRCGIESWFVDQSEARAIEQQLLQSGAIAKVRVDRWGNASIVDLTPDLTP